VTRGLPQGPRGPVNAAAGLVSLSFLGAALKRRRRLWITMAVVGLVFGASIYVFAPPSHQASTSLILTYPATEDSADAIQTDVALAQTRAVAGKVVHDLGLRESTTQLLSSYTVVDETDQIMTITVSARSSGAAVREANALAAAFLQVRAAGIRRQQQLFTQSVSQQIRTAQDAVDADNAALARLQAKPASAQRQKQVTAMQAELARDESMVIGLQDTATVTPAATEQQIRDSYVYDTAAPVPQSRLRVPLQYTVAGLLLGLVVGVGLVLVEALVSDRLRRRDDVARALAAPVELSVGRVRAGRFAVWDHLVARRAGRRERDMERIVVYLGSLVPDGAGRAPGLAVVPVGKPAAAALAVVRLAVSCAQRGVRVMVADLDEGRPVARLLGDTSAGVRTVSFGGQPLILAVPDQIFPIGPLHPQAAVAQPTLASAYASAELLLTLATADPALGLDNLPTWASRAVVMVTAGECSAARIHAAGEVIRLSGTQLISAILLDADTTDDSISLWPLPESDVAQRQAADLAAGQSAALELDGADEILSAMVGAELATEASDLVPPQGARRRK